MTTSPIRSHETSPMESAEPTGNRRVALPTDHDRDSAAGPIAVPIRPPVGGDRSQEWWSALFVAFLHRISGSEHLYLLDGGADQDVISAYSVEVFSTDSIRELQDRTAGVLGGMPTLGPISEAERTAGYGGQVWVGRPLPAGWTDSDGLGGVHLRLVRDAAGSLLLLADAGRWLPDTVRRMAGHLGMLAAGADAAASIGEINLLDEGERALLLRDWNDTAVSWPGGSYLELLHERVQAAPDQPALEYHGRITTFAELAERSNRVANLLIQHGAQPGTRVGLLAERSDEFVIGVLGILKTGAAAVLLDPVNPDARLHYLMRDSRPVAVLAADRLLSRVPENLVGLRLTGPEVARAAATAPAVEITDDMVSHLIYTSGSTGEPKAVLERHAALTNLVHWTGRAYGVRPGDRASWLSTPGFAVQLMECMPYLALGVAVHIGDLENRTPQQIRDWLVEHRITHTMLVAALAERVWALDWPADAALRIMVTTAERVHSWPPTDRPFVVVMTYGSTETTNVLSCLDIGARSDLTANATAAEVRAVRPVPVGRPISNLRVYLLDAADQPVPVGVVGRLHIAGAGLAAGYHERPELTAQKFRANPLPEEPGAVLYDSGDLARYRADGAIELLGRGDSQVKIRGFRVELGEVESVLCAAPDVREAVVTTMEPTPGDVQLIGYVAGDGEAPDAGSVRGYVTQRLPHYMVPSVVVPLAALPRLANGKTDLTALPAPDHASRNTLAGELVRPSDPVQEELARIYRELFRLAEVGVEDNFFELGGHSLLAFRMIDEVRNSFAVELSLPDLYANPTIAGIARLVSQSLAEGRQAGFGGIPQIEPDPANRHRPFPLTDSQQALWIGRGDAVALGNVGCHGYFEWESAELEPERFGRAWRRLVERHDSLRTVIRSDGTQQVLTDPGEYEIAVLDLRDRPYAEAEQELTELRERLSHQVMADEQWPLFDVRLSRYTDPTGQQLVRLHLSLDFLICDAWSYFQILIPDLVELYAEPDRELPELQLSFRDYVTWTAAHLPGSDIYRRSELYWMQRLASLAHAPALPSRPADQPELPLRFDRRAFRMDPQRWDRLKALGQDRGVTPSVILAAVFAEVLRSRTGQPHFTLNFPLFNRMPLHPQVNQVLGDTTTTLLLLAEKSDGTFVERAQALQQRLWMDLEHRYFSGVQVLRELTRRRGTMTAAMPVVMTSLLGHPPRHQPAALGRTIHSISQTPQVSIDFQVFEVAGELQFNWDFLPGLFPDGLVPDMFDDFCRVLCRLVDQPSDWQLADFGLAPATAASPAAESAPAPESAPALEPTSAARHSGPAWERFWSGVRRTGDGGDVLWDTGAGSEQQWTMEQARIHLHPALPVVDIGCGNGRYTRAFAACFPFAVGVDVAASAVQRAKAESVGVARASYRVLDVADPAQATALAEEIGDANVFVRAVLHVLDPASRTLAAEALAELVGERGVLLLLEPHYREGSFGYVGFVGGNRGRVSELVGPLERAGVGASSRFSQPELDTYFADGWQVLAAGDVQMDAVDPEAADRAIKIPAFFAALRRR